MEYKELMSQLLNCERKLRQLVKKTKILKKKLLKNINEKEIKIIKKNSKRIVINDNIGYVLEVGRQHPSEKDLNFKKIQEQTIQVLPNKLIKNNFKNKIILKEYSRDISDITKFSETKIAENINSKLSKETNMEFVHNMFVHIIQQQKQKEKQHDIWENSPYKDLVKLQSNNVGIVGEQLINNICKLANIPATCDGSKTKQIGGGEGDGKIMNIPIEIKTSHQGSVSLSFQHELGEVPWKMSKYMIFVDISPTCIYLTIFKNFDEITYKSKQKLPCFPTKTITWRKKTGAFKLDTTVKINEQSIKNGHAIKITPTTHNEDIASFIRKIIV